MRGNIRQACLFSAEFHSIFPVLTYCFIFQFICQSTCQTIHLSIHSSIYYLSIHSNSRVPSGALNGFYSGLNSRKARWHIGNLCSDEGWSTRLLLLVSVHECVCVVVGCTDSLRFFSLYSGIWAVTIYVYLRVRGFGGVGWSKSPRWQVTVSIGLYLWLTHGPTHSHIHVHVCRA